MTKHIIVTIRYSLLSEKLNKSWVIGRKEFDDYKQELFNITRLNQRQALFERLTLKSLIKIHNNLPADVSFTVHVITSADLPKDHLVFLDEVSKSNNFIQIKKHDEQGANLNSDFLAFLDDLPMGDMYASVRLDDDDALSVEYVEELAKYFNPLFDDFVVSLGSGYAALINEAGDVEQMAKYKWRFASAGLAYIGTKKAVGNKNIYQCGSHTRTDDRHRTISFANGVYLVRAFHSFNDSKDDFGFKDLLSEDEASKTLSVFLD